MKTLLSILLLPLALFSMTSAVQLRAGYFYPTSKLIRHVYHNGGIEGEIEGSVNVYRKLDLFANTGVFVRKGHTEALNTSTSIQIYPLSLGLKYYFPLSCKWDFYLGIAPTYTWAVIHDHYPFVKQHVHKGAFGVVAKSGFVYSFWKRSFADLFIDYYYARIGGTHFPGVTPVSQNIGGLRTGLGLGVKF